MMGYDQALEAVKQDGMALRFVPEALHTEAVCLEAVKQTGYAFTYVLEELKKIIMEKMKDNFIRPEENKKGDRHNIMNLRRRNHGVPRSFTEERRIGIQHESHGILYLLHKLKTELSAWLIRKGFISLSSSVSSVLYSVPSVVKFIKNIML